MTRLPEDLAARLGAAAPGGIDFSSTATQHGVVSAWCGLANSAELVPVAKVLHALGARLSMVSARQLPAPEEEDEEEEEEAAEGEAQAAKPEKVPPRPSAARLWTARPTRSTITSICAATR